MGAQIRNKLYCLQYSGETCQFTLYDYRGERLYQTVPLPGRTEALSQAEKQLCFLYCIGSQRIQVTVVAEAGEQFSITLQQEGSMEEIAFPGAWMPEQGDRLVYPLGEGMMFPADKMPKAIPSRLFFSNGSQLSMGLVGLLRGAGGLFTCIEETADAALVWQRNKEGLTESQLTFQPTKGEWGYPRRIRLIITMEDGFNALCRDYRAWRRTMGLVVPLLEKAKVVPAITSMAGRADLWLFDDQNMNRLYGRPIQAEETPRDICKAADEMIALGMERMLINSFEGETPQDIASLKEKGFQVGRYDIYQDVIPKPNLPFMLPYRVKRSRHTEACWPRDVRLTAEGEYAEAWSLRGTDGKTYPQHAVCDIPALRMTREDVPPLIQEGGYTSWFIDVGTGAQRSECYHPDHPMDRRDAMRYLRAQNQYLMELGLICGVEVGCEAAVDTYVFSEGMMSPPFFRAPDSGRNMNTLYYGEDVPAAIEAYMLNPSVRVPLWQMVYHDCVINYWYWGDSSNCCPELMQRRDQFNALYALPPLYSVNMTQWEQLKAQIAQSYHRATPVARVAAFSPLSRFEWLTADGLVQQTTYENGVCVKANFGTETYDGIQPGGCRAVDARDNIICEF